MASIVLVFEIFAGKMSLFKINYSQFWREANVIHFLRILTTTASSDVVVPWADPTERRTAKTCHYKFCHCAQQCPRLSVVIVAQRRRQQFRWSYCSGRCKGRVPNFIYVRVLDFMIKPKNFGKVRTLNKPTLTVEIIFILNCLFSNVSFKSE